jgi:DNA-binding Xre family transcriptional regulator
MNDTIAHSSQSDLAFDRTPDHPSDHKEYAQHLRQLMLAVGVESFRELAVRSQVSRRAIDKLKQGGAETLKYQDLDRLCQILAISLAELVTRFSKARNPSINSPVNDSINSSSLANGTESEIKTEVPIPSELHAEYQRLKQQLAQQGELLRADFQQESLQILESLLLQLPTAAHAAQTNATMPARNLLPLLRPIDRLLKHWGIEAIASVGAEIAYNPHKHQLMDGTAEIGTPVIVRYVGYEQGEKLLYRARVSLKS